GDGAWDSGSGFPARFGDSGVGKRRGGCGDTGGAELSEEGAPRESAEAGVSFLLFWLLLFGFGIPEIVRGLHRVIHLGS
ncbi:MAG TPA: hypothetical protein VG672_08105, partial [Bryobacteraceae bacterium]|nr:hypothetical protein [Bryobacteraceae bacterium]